MKGNEMEIFTPLKIFCIVITTFVIMLLAKEYVKAGIEEGGRIQQYREFAFVKQVGE